MPEIPDKCCYKLHDLCSMSTTYDLMFHVVVWLNLLTKVGTENGI